MRGTTARRACFGPATAAEPVTTSWPVTWTASASGTGASSSPVSTSTRTPTTPLQFTKEQAKESPIDHIVPISFAWQMGAAVWSRDKRLQFANDPLNLVLTSDTANSAKGDSDPASWLPPNKAIRCPYVQRFAQVSLKYSMPVTPADKQIMLAQCSSGSA